MNLRVDSLAMNLNSSRVKASASNSSAREMVECSESNAQEESQICVEVACTVLCTMVVLVLVKF